MLSSSVVPALPTMQHDLHTSASSVAWILTAYLLSASVATPILGRLGDMFGKEKLLMAALVGLAIGTLLAAIATSIGLMIVARAIQGLGAGIFPLAFGIIRDEFPRDKVAGSIGLMSALLGVGGGLGVVLAGPIVQHLDYHWLFWFPLIGVLACIVLTHFYVPESPIKTPASINWLGAALMTLGLTAVLIAIILIAGAIGRSHASKAKEAASLSAEDEASKYLAFAAYARLKGDMPGAGSALDTLIAHQPSMLEASRPETSAALSSERSAMPAG